MCSLHLLPFLVDEMGSRIDDLEKSIGELMAQAGKHSFSTAIACCCASDACAFAVLSLQTHELANLHL